MYRSPPARADFSAPSRYSCSIVESIGIKEDMPGTTSLILDFVDRGITRRRIFVNPTKTVIARTLDEVLPALRAIEDASRRGRFAAGFISYEAAPAFEPAFQVHHNP